MAHNSITLFLKISTGTEILKKKIQKFLFWNEPNCPKAHQANQEPGNFMTSRNFLAPDWLDHPRGSLVRSKMKICFFFDFCTIFG